MELKEYLKSVRDSQTVDAEIYGYNVSKIFTCQYPNFNYRGFPKALYEWGLRENFGSPTHTITKWYEFKSLDQEQYNVYTFIAGDEYNNLFCELHSAWRSFLYWVYKEGKMPSLLDMMKSYFFTNTEVIMSTLK